MLVASFSFSAIGSTRAVGPCVGDHPGTKRAWCYNRGATDVADSVGGSMNLAGPTWLTAAGENSLFED